jgi:hypothetical protein
MPQMSRGCRGPAVSRATNTRSSAAGGNVATAPLVIRVLEETALLDQDVVPEVRASSRSSAVTNWTSMLMGILTLRHPGAVHTA